ncbi:uncharacterized protein LOC110983843 [Acanthaster planci]|uniref:Uncharacterized protein LOC110983843 n=1 Tax=Acanthaster planci TaxID=133434 RepID=A0A8B7Z2Y7_ACAPL|nr:uncharacterized protein LOC110983843 [Acanthaster planci]
MAEEKVVHSGYLLHRPGGALGRWKKKRYWFQLDEVSCQLRQYKSQAELCHTVGTVDIRDACISILPDHQNHILVACRGKEHILIAENHRSMMQWLQNLQEVRDLFSCVKSNRNQVKLSRTLTYKPTTASPSKGLASSPASSLRRQHSARGKSKNLGDLPASFSASVETNDSYAAFKKNLVGSLSIPSNKNSFIYDSLETSPTSMRSCNSIASHSSTEELPTSSGWTSPSGGQAPTDASDQSERGATEGECPEPKLDGAALEDSGSIKTWRQLDKEALIEQLQQMKQLMEQSKKNFKSLENREQAYKQMLKKREQDIMHLDDKLGIMEQAHHLRRDLLSPEDMDAAQQRILDLQDTCKVYQEQNGFLNTEVRRQASLRRREQVKLDIQNRLIDGLEGRILQSQQDYFQLLGQVIKVTSLDPKDDIPLPLSWEDKRLKSFLELFHEARQQDPCLPDPRVVMVEGYTDIYGFQHPTKNQPLLLHYLCQILQDHLLAASRRSTELNKKWEECASNGNISTLKQEELRELVYEGIPTDYRSEIWSHLVLQRVKQLKAEKSEDYFQWLCNRTGTSSSVDKYRRQIELDLLRTMPHNIHFNNKDAEGVKQLRQILEAFCVHNPTVGYCQGMNFIAGTCLLFMDVEMAFWCMVAVVESYFPANYFDSSLIGAQADQNILKDILELRLPRLHAHLDDVGIEMCSFTLNWFLAIFFDVVPFTMLLRIWDCFLFDGLRVLFQFSIALLQYHETSLLEKKDILAILKDTKSMAKLTQDVQAIVNLVRESNDSFPSSAWIQQKQQHYMSVLRAVYEQQEKAREEFEKQEGLAPAMPVFQREGEDALVNDLKMDCAVECYSGHLLVCRGELRQGWVGRVNISKCIKQNYGIRLDNRIVCLTMAGIDMALLGTVSNFLYAFSIGTQEELWFERLRDTPLSIVHDQQTRNVYIGLADGTMAVIEGVSHASPRDIFYHGIGAGPVRSVLYLPELDQIWCACGNAVNILDNSLNVTDGFEISKCPDIHISGLYRSDHGVWVTVRGSAIVMLWDPRQLQCLLLHDTSMDQTPIHTKPHENHARSKITSLLPYENTLWVGTADGHLTIYKIDKASMPKSGMTLENGDHNSAGESEGSDKGLKEKSEKEQPEAETLETARGEVDGGGDGDEDDEEMKPQDTSSQTLKEFVIVESSEGLPESQPGSDTDTKSKNHLPHLAKLQDTVGTVTSSDDEHRSKPKPGPSKAVRKHRKGSRKGGYKGGPRDSPRALRKVWQTRQKSSASSAERPEPELLSPRTSKTMEKVQSVFGKFSLGTTPKSKQYRYSRELRDETRRGSRICVTDATEPSTSAMSLMSLVDAESTVLRPPSVLSRDSLSEVYAQYASRPRPPLFDASEIEVRPGYELNIEAKRKISDHQVRCLVLTSLEDGNPAIVSCAGFYGDDESMLRWTCHTRENVWMQVPIEDTTT